ncbi:MAG: N-acetylneuraminate synthase family protein [Gammaproteobacteria bacterium]|nr:N-acetylneuraminate synthase family protein [Gammaproteobacteria bacterium]
MADTWLHNPRDGAPCTVIVEVGQAHDGSLGMAHAFIDAIAKGGADAVKFQTHIAEAESTRDEPWRTKFSSQDATRIDYWRRMEFSEAQWQELKTHASDRSLLFLSSPFSLEAVGLLQTIGVAGWKTASGETSNHALIDAMAVTGLPMIVSTGMSTLAEVDEVVARIGAQGAALALLQCTSAYPCPPELVGLNVIGEFRARYGCAAGLSDHSATIYPGLAAAAQGIEILEVHLTLSREMFGPDVPASVTPAELRQLVDGIRFIETMRANPVDKQIVPEPIGSLRKIFTKSVVVTEALKSGTVLERTHLAVKKPGSGIPANALEELIGRRLARAVVPDQLLSYDDLE